MTGVLDGTLVIDLAQGWAGPGAAMYLADQGAEVIKVEPLAGDIARGWYPSPALKGTSRSFLAINRNKQGIAVDLSTPDGRRIAHDLARIADVVITNLQQRTAERLRVDYATLSAVNERLVYAHVSGYGDRGPYAGQPAFDQIIQGLSGAMDRTLEDGTPLRPGVWVADTSAPMLLAYGITLALLARERTGRGQKVDTSLLQAAVALQVVDLVGLERHPDLAEQSLRASGVYRCSDGRYINVAAFTEPQLIALCSALELERLLQDESFLSEERDLTLMQRRWRPEMAGAFATRTADEWLHTLMEVDVPCGPVLTREEVLREPQVLQNEAIVAMEHPEAGAIKIAGVPVRLSDNAGGVRSPAPSLGEHTDVVLARIGYSAQQIADLRERKVVA